MVPFTVAGLKLHALPCMACGEPVNEDRCAICLQLSQLLFRYGYHACCFRLCRFIGVARQVSLHKNVYICKSLVLLRENKSSVGVVIDVVKHDGTVLGGIALESES